MRPAKQNKLPVGHGPAAGSVRGPPMLDCLGEAIRQMLELMRRELDDVRPDHEQLRSELADVTTICRDIRRRAGLAAERVADHLGSVRALAAFFPGHARGVQGSLQRVAPRT